MLYLWYHSYQTQYSPICHCWSGLVSIVSPCLLFLDRFLVCPPPPLAWWSWVMLGGKSGWDRGGGYSPANISTSKFEALLVACGPPKWLDKVCWQEEGMAPMPVVPVIDEVEIMFMEPGLLLLGDWVTAEYWRFSKSDLQYILESNIPKWSPVCSSEWHTVQVKHLTWYMLDWALIIISPEWILS